jgi:hypothetical protein
MSGQWQERWRPVHADIRKPTLQVRHGSSTRKRKELVALNGLNGRGCDQPWREAMRLKILMRSRPVVARLRLFACSAKVRRSIPVCLHQVSRDWTRAKQGDADRRTSGGEVVVQAFRNPGHGVLRRAIDRSRATRKPHDGRSDDDMGVAWPEQHARHQGLQRAHNAHDIHLPGPLPVSGLR